MEMQVNPTPALVVRHARLDDPEVAPLLDELAEEYRRRYGDGPTFSRRPEQFVPPRGCFLAASMGGETVACGGYRALPDGAVELKRMYVRPAARGLGVARTLLARLEREAVAQGVGVIRLETGVRQPEAVALYTSAGYARIPNYGTHAQDHRSLCFEKRLGGASREVG